jgi:hypothetical protein
VQIGTGGRPAAGGLSAVTTGIVIQKMVADGDDVLTWCDLHTSVAAPLNWCRVKIVRVRAVVDQRAFFTARQVS